MCANAEVQLVSFAFHSGRSQVFFFIFLFLIYIYLAAPGLSCGAWDLQLQHVNLQLQHMRSSSLTGDSRPSALEAWSLSHWKTREVPGLGILKQLFLYVRVQQMSKYIKDNGTHTPHYWAGELRIQKRRKLECCPRCCCLRIKVNSLSDEDIQ